MCILIYIPYGHVSYLAFQERISYLRPNRIIRQISQKGNLVQLNVPFSFPFFQFLNLLSVKILPLLSVCTLSECSLLPVV